MVAARLECQDHRQRHGRMCPATLPPRCHRDKIAKTDSDRYCWIKSKVLPALMMSDNHAISLVADRAVPAPLFAAGPLQRSQPLPARRAVDALGFWLVGVD